MFTPFRYRPYPAGSRFRRAGLTPGAWHGAEAPDTAAAEMVFDRFLFYAESPETPFPDDVADCTAFSVEMATPVALDLIAGALAADHAAWTHLIDYASCQALAEDARAIGAGIIRYLSVRDPSRGANLAVLNCRAFAASQPGEHQTWRIRIGPNGAQARREHPRLGLEFSTDTFAPDPRLDGMNWNRARAR